MNRAALIALAAGDAVAAPAAASATMAYVTAPRNINSRPQVMVANDNGTGARSIGTGMSAVISPDGARVAYQATSTAPGSDFEGQLVDLASGTTVSLGTACVGPLTWSPDSKWIACQTQSVNARDEVTGNGLGLISVPASVAGAS